MSKLEQAGFYPLTPQERNELRKVIEHFLKSLDDFLDSQIIIGKVDVIKDLIRHNRVWFDERVAKIKKEKRRQR